MMKKTSPQTKLKKISDEIIKLKDIIKRSEKQIHNLEILQHKISSPLLEKNYKNTFWRSKKFFQNEKYFYSYFRIDKIISNRKFIGLLLEDNPDDRIHICLKFTMNIDILGSFEKISNKEFYKEYNKIFRKVGSGFFT